MDTYCAATSFPGLYPAGRVGENPGNEVDCVGTKGVRLERADCILGLQPRDKAAILGARENDLFSLIGVNTIEFFLEKFTWK